MAYYSSKLWGKKSVLNADAFIAPANFDPASQPLNIVSVFGDYANANKAYIYSFTSAIATLTLPASAGITYRWGETISGVDYVNDVVSGTAFTAGSTKRYVIVNSTATSLIANIASYNGFNGAVWIYCSSKIYRVAATSNNYLKYVHFENLNSMTVIYAQDFYGYSGLIIEGVLTINNIVTSIGNSAFYSAKSITKIVVGSSVSSIGTYSFAGMKNVTSVYCYATSAPTVGTGGFALDGAVRPLHVKIGATGYNVAPFTNTAIFSSIIYDL